MINHDHGYKRLFSHTEIPHGGTTAELSRPVFYQDLLDTRQIAPGQRLPPVLPIVLYNGQRPCTATTAKPY